MGVARAYRVATPYNGVELAELNYEQTTDTLYLAHIDHAPGKLARTGHTDWLHSDLTFGPDIAAPTGLAVVETEPNVDAANSGDNYSPQPATYVVTAVNDDAGQESRASSGVTATNDLSLKRNYNTVSWSAVAGATRYNVYKADNEQFYGYIGTTESTTFRDVNIGPALDRAPPQADNPFDSVNNYPAVIALFEQRLIWGRTRNIPNGIWGSRAGVNELENMDRSRPGRADDAFSLAVVSQQVNPIHQLVSSTSLLALTANGIFKVDGDGQGGPLAGNSTPLARRQVGRGASTLRTLISDTVAFYQPQPTGSIRAVGYTFEVDGFKTNDVSIYSPHLFEGFEIVDWAISQEPRSLIWAVRSDGKLLCFTWEQEQGVAGWTLCETDGEVKSICAIREGGQDRIYIQVDRTWNGVTRRFIERMASHIWEDVEQTCFMDCAVSGTFDPPRGTFSTLWHLEGREDVVAIVDGAYFTGLSVVNGQMTLPGGATGSVVSVGIPYQVDVKTLPVRVNAQDGSNLGKRQQPGDIVLHMRRSAGFQVGIDENHLYPVKQRQVNYGDPQTPFDGVTDPLTMANKAQNEIEVHIRQTLPGPFELLAIGVDPIIGG